MRVLSAKLRNCKIVFPAVSDSPQLYAESERGMVRSSFDSSTASTRRLSRQFVSVALQLGHVVEGVGAAQLTSVNSSS